MGEAGKPSRTGGGIDGYDPDEHYRTWRRLEVEEDEKRIKRELGAIREKVDKNSLSSWENSVNDYLSRITGKGLISAQQNADIDAKEVQLASWLAKAGHDVVFLKKSSIPATHIPDILLDGEKWR